ncbi:MAG: hypothetical protein O9276_16365 [Microcystis sp. LE17-20A]|jgi:DNA segregation ATPase FtsK/SpoIIIE-like protein|uniref:hypothetical protein n=1 Tax=unclassified Microcystis TaxID=2643300 RepID=UPI0005EE33B5|nr:MULTISPECIES: hypothetical protein [unclassified Microcystis]MCZ8039644.1 hypothetical protein [Microcystis sp. LE17-20A]MCZ8213327.1 hypothetical protein [Microcystis sp. LE19-8.1F]
MNSATLPSFWQKYRDLKPAVKAGARKAYRLWVENPFHPSLNFFGLAIMMSTKSFIRKTEELQAYPTRTLKTHLPLSYTF